MAPSTLLLAAVLSFASAATYGYAGLRLRRRQVVGPAGVSWNLFLTWWFAIAGAAFVSGVLQALAWSGRTQLALFLVGQHLSFLLVCTAYFGLMHYLFTLFTGRWGVWKVLLGFYILFYLILVYDVSAGHPTAVEVNRWGTGLQYSSVLSPVLAATIYSLLILPPLLGSLAYASLYYRVPHRSGRYRLLLVAICIFLWAIISVLIAMPTWQSVDALQFTIRLAGALLAFVIVAAYFPARWIQHRLRVETVSEA